MRKHVLKELGHIAVSTTDLRKEGMQIDTMYLSPDHAKYERALDADVLAKLTEAGSKYLAEVAKELPEGMSVQIVFGVLPEHDAQLLGE